MIDCPECSGKGGFVDDCECMGQGRCWNRNCREGTVHVACEVCSGTGRVEPEKDLCEADSRSHEPDPAPTEQPRSTLTDEWADHLSRLPHWRAAECTAFPGGEHAREVAAEFAERMVKEGKA